PRFPSIRFRSSRRGCSATSSGPRRRNSTDETFRLRFRPARGADRHAPGPSPPGRAAARRGGGGRGRSAPRPARARPAGPSGAWRPAGTERHQGHSRPARGHARTDDGAGDVSGPDRGDASRTASRGALGGAREAAAQAEGGRVDPVFRPVGGPGRKDRGGAGRAFVRPDRPCLRCRAGRGGADAAAALHRRASRPGRAGRRGLPDRLRPPVGRRGRADRLAALRRGASRAARREGRGLHPCHAPCRRRHLPAGEGRGPDDPPDARGVGRGERRGRRRDQCNAGGGRAGDSGRHHGLEAHRDGGRLGRGPAVARPDRHLHLPRLPLPRDRRADDQLPPAEVHPSHARLGADGKGADGARLCPCDRAGLPLLLLRRCLAPPARPPRAAGGRSGPDLTAAEKPARLARRERKTPPMLTVLRNSWALLLGMMLLMLGNGMQGTLLGIRGGIEGFTTTEMSYVMAAYFAGFLFGSRMTPEMIRRVGHVRVFAALGSMISAVLIMYAAAPDWIAWAAMRVLIGFSFSGGYITAESWLNNASTNETRGQALSLYMIMQMIGIIAAQALLNFGDPSGYILFVIPSVLVSLAFTPILLTASQAPAFETTKRLSFVALYRASPLGCVGMFLLGGVFASQFGMSAVWGTAEGLNVREISIFVAAIYVGGLVFQYPIGWASDR